MEYIIVHTDRGYLAYNKVSEQGKYGEALSPSFTKDIAHATTFTNFQSVKTLCNMYMASAWSREDDSQKFSECYTPKNTFNMLELTLLRRRQV